MPVVIAAVLISVLAGLAFPRRTTAFAVGAVFGALTLVSFVWAVADGKGDDPWWEVLIGVGGAVLCVAAAAAGARLRPSTSHPSPTTR